MSANPAEWRVWRTVLPLFLFLSIPSVGLTRTKRGVDSDITNIIRPELVNAQTDPTLRFPIMRARGIGFQHYLRLVGHQQQHDSLLRGATHQQVRPLFPSVQVCNR